MWCNIISYPNKHEMCSKYICANYNSVPTRWRHWRNLFVVPSLNHKHTIHREWFFDNLEWKPFTNTKSYIIWCSSFVVSLFQLFQILLWSLVSPNVPPHFIVFHHPCIIEWISNALFCWLFLVDCSLSGQHRNINNNIIENQSNNNKTYDLMVIFDSNIRWT